MSTIDYKKTVNGMVNKLALLRGARIKLMASH